VRHGTVNKKEANLLYKPLTSGGGVVCLPMKWGEMGKLPHREPVI
jgi:hypothetical protein